MVCAVAKVVYDLDDGRRVVPSELLDSALVRAVNERIGHLSLCPFHSAVK
jgi:hypothetical protein